MNLDDLALKVGCRTRTLPTTYLGLPLGMRHNATKVWDVVEEKFRKKLALWKRLLDIVQSFPLLSYCIVSPMSVYIYKSNM